MTELKTLFLPLFRRSSASAKSSTSSALGQIGDGPRSRSRTSLLLPQKHRKATTEEPAVEGSAGRGQRAAPVPQLVEVAEARSATEPQQTPDTSRPTATSTSTQHQNHDPPAIRLQEPTPTPLTRPLTPDPDEGGRQRITADAAPTEAESESRPELGRPQSLTLHSQTRFIKTLLDSAPASLPGDAGDYFAGPSPTLLHASMLHRKIWVKRPGSSATLVTINEDDLVDDVREMILKKYKNSLGRSFDAPDVTLRIVVRDHLHRHPHPPNERILGPDEPIARTLDAYYPGGQTVDEALVIDVPQRRTPRQSPRASMPYYAGDDFHPVEGGTDYFSQMPAGGGAPSPHLPSNLITTGAGGTHHHSIAILNNGPTPSLPSPGGRGSRHTHRPKYSRNSTHSPIVLTIPGAHNGTPCPIIPPIPIHSFKPNRSANTAFSPPPENRPSHPSVAPIPPPLPTPPITVAPQRTITPPPRLSSSPRPQRSKRNAKKSTATHPAYPHGPLDGTVPPINVLIVEDNIINLKVLEAFMKRLKVRWQSAMNGKDAVHKWRGGGFHLVLMDIQLPVMNGLDATKEIRRLERVNGVGVLMARVGRRSGGVGGGGGGDGGQGGEGTAMEKEAGTETETAELREGGAGKEREMEREREVEGEDRLTNTTLFKSSVIIVALTASSLQSDRHEALAAGCNDFLTKVSSIVLFFFPLLSRKHTHTHTLSLSLFFFFPLGLFVPIDAPSPYTPNTQFLSLLLLLLPPPPSPFPFPPSSSLPSISGFPSYPPSLLTPHAPRF